MMADTVRRFVETILGRYPLVDTRQYKVVICSLPDGSD